MRVRIRNYQSVAAADFEIVGLTAVTGESNIGKSAIVRAVAAAIFGQLGDHYIREGEAACGVRVEDDNLTIRWVKTTQPSPTLQNELEINGKRHTKLGREHAVLTEPLGFKDLREIQDLHATRPQIAHQTDPPFLVSETEGTRAEVLRVLSRADDVATAQRRARADLVELGRKLELRKADTVVAAAAAAELDRAAELRVRMDALKTQAISTEESTRKHRSTAAKILRLRELEPRRIPAVPSLPAQPKAVSLLVKARLLRQAREAEILASAAARDAAALILRTIEEKARLERELGVCPTCERPFAA